MPPLSVCGKVSDPRDFASSPMSSCSWMQQQRCATIAARTGNSRFWFTWAGLNGDPISAPPADHLVSVAGVRYCVKHTCRHHRDPMQVSPPNPGRSRNRARAPKLADAHGRIGTVLPRSTHVRYRTSSLRSDPEQLTPHARACAQTLCTCPSKVTLTIISRQEKNGGSYVFSILPYSSVPKK